MIRTTPVEKRRHLAYTRSYSALLSVKFARILNEHVWKDFIALDAGLGQDCSRIPCTEVKHGISCVAKFSRASSRT
jgi:hypothetical protein